MNPLFLIRILLSIKDYRNRLEEESEKFDQEHNIQKWGAGTKRMAHLMLGLKIAVLGSIMGEFPFLDLIPNLIGFWPKMEWVGALLVLWLVGAILLVLINDQDRDERRAKAARNGVG